MIPMLYRFGEIGLRWCFFAMRNTSINVGVVLGTLAPGLGPDVYYLVEATLWVAILGVRSLVLAAVLAPFSPGNSHRA